MFWIALELSIPNIGLNIMLSLTVKEIDAVEFDGVAEPDNNGLEIDEGPALNYIGQDKVWLG